MQGITNTMANFIGLLLQGQQQQQQQAPVAQILQALVELRVRGESQVKRPRTGYTGGCRLFAFKHNECNIKMCVCVCVWLRVRVGNIMGEWFGWAHLRKKEDVTDDSLELEFGGEAPKVEGFSATHHSELMPCLGETPLTAFARDKGGSLG